MCCLIFCCLCWLYAAITLPYSWGDYQTSTFFHFHTLLPPLIEAPLTKGSLKVTGVVVLSRAASWAVFLKDGASFMELKNWWLESLQFFLLKNLGLKLLSNRGLGVCHERWSHLRCMLAWRHPEALDWKVSESFRVWARADWATCSCCGCRVHIAYMCLNLKLVRKARYRLMIRCSVAPREWRDWFELERLHLPSAQTYEWLGADLVGWLRLCVVGGGLVIAEIATLILFF